MHELTIAVRIIESLEEEMGDVDDLLVRSVSVQVGPLSGVVPEALLFCWDLAVEGTRFAHARLEIERSEVVGLCPACREECLISNVQSLRCPSCRSPVHRVVRGNELEILTIDVEEMGVDPRGENLCA
jgi:hydrogenase nickel incorporation protein HypA/HybF